VHVTFNDQDIKAAGNGGPPVAIELVLTFVLVVRT
jgi:hypothetical protein